MILNYIRLRLKFWKFEEGGGNFFNLSWCRAPNKDKICLKIICIRLEKFLRTNNIKTMNVKYNKHDRLPSKYESNLQRAEAKYGTIWKTFLFVCLVQFFEKIWLI